SPPTARWGWTLPAPCSSPSIATVCVCRAAACRRRRCITATGAMILGLIKSGFTFVGVDAYVQDIIKGIIIVAAVTIDMRRNR
ncbi:hypothetical protein LUD23_30390, partial [Klebsiella pneumoniae]|nr:hypothetical protein [Klebsiella pneumoniae]